MVKRNVANSVINLDAQEIAEYSINRDYKRGGLGGWAVLKLGSLQ